MFTIKRAATYSYRITNEDDNHLHSDGSVYRTPEYWPTRELAQAVLDKYQPKHVWEHGDIFMSGNLLMIYIQYCYDKLPQAICLNPPVHGPATGRMNARLARSTFLFNIKDKLESL